MSRNRIEDSGDHIPGFPSIVAADRKRTAEKSTTGTVRVLEVRQNPQDTYKVKVLYCSSCHSRSRLYQSQGKDRHCPHCHVRWTNWSPDFEKYFKKTA